MITDLDGGKIDLDREYTVAISTFSANFEPTKYILTNDQSIKKLNYTKNDEKNIQYIFCNFLLSFQKT